MSINLSSNFNLIAGLPLDDRTVVADLTARDAIASIQRYEGLIVYVISDQTNYQLQGGITNTDWVAIGTGGASTLEIANVAFVSQNGDDATGVVGRLDLPFRNILPAWQAMNAYITANALSPKNCMIYFYSGDYEIPNGGIWIQNANQCFKFYLSQGVRLLGSTNSSSFRFGSTSFSPRAIDLEFYGYGRFLNRGDDGIFQNLGASEAVPCSVIGYFNSIEQNSGDFPQTIVTSCNLQLFCPIIQNHTFLSFGWTRTTVACDKWTNVASGSSDGSLLRSFNWNGQNGDLKQTALGNGYMILKGLTGENCYIDVDKTSGGIPYAFRTDDNATTSNGYIEAHTDGVIRNAYGFGCHQGKMFHYGRLKSLLNRVVYWQFLGSSGGTCDFYSNAIVDAGDAQVAVVLTRGNYTLDGFYKSNNAVPFLIGHDYDTATVCNFVFRGVGVGTNASGNVFRIRNYVTTLGKALVTFERAVVYNINAAAFSGSNYIINWDNDSIDFQKADFFVNGYLKINGVINPDMFNLSVQAPVYADVVTRIAEVNL